MIEYVGLDVHKENFHATVMDEEGEILRRQRFSNSLEGVKSFFADIENGEVALEASYFWEPVYDELEEMGFEVKLAHPRKTRIIADEKIKTDCRDSGALADLVRADLIPEVYVPCDDRRELRRTAKQRGKLVQGRTKFKNRVKAQLRRRGIEHDGLVSHAKGGLGLYLVRALRNKPRAPRLRRPRRNAKMWHDHG